MKHVAPFLAACLVSSCSTQVMKRAHVIPVYDNQVLLSARPAFIGQGKGLYDDPYFIRPKIWNYEQLNDGSTVVHWVSTLGSHERLALMDAGFHPIIVPPEAITVFSSPGGKVDPQNPTAINIVGTNTAFIPEAVTLVPYKPITKYRPNKRMKAVPHP